MYFNSIAHAAQNMAPVASSSKRAAANTTDGSKAKKHQKKGHGQHEVVMRWQGPKASDDGDADDENRHKLGAVLGK